MREAILKRLGVGLAEAAKLEVADGQNRELWRVERALDAVNTYLREFGFKNELRQPLLDLQAAMGDVAEGRKSSLLKKGRSNGSPGRSVKGRAQMPLAAALVTLLAQAEKQTSMRDAAKFVEREFGLKGLFDYRNNLTSLKLSHGEFKQYEEWLENIANGELNMSKRQLVKTIAGLKT